VREKASDVGKKVVYLKEGRNVQLKRRSGRLEEAVPGE
jgi:hypothetical protein